MGPGAVEAAGAVVEGGHGVSEGVGAVAFGAGLPAEAAGAVEEGGHGISEGAGAVSFRARLLAFFAWFGEETTGGALAMFCEGIVWPDLLALLLTATAGDVATRGPTLGATTPPDAVAFRAGLLAFFAQS